MAVVVYRRPFLHPIHAVLAAGALPLFLGALLSDLAYAASYQIQWKNFASWLLVGGLTFSGFAGLWALVGLARWDRRGRSSVFYVLLLLTSWLLGFINALIHAKDAWASMPESTILSAVVATLVIAAVGFGFAAAGERKFT